MHGRLRLRRGQPDAFRLPDASAACRLAPAPIKGARLVCAGLGTRAGVALAARGAPRAAAGHIWWDAGTPVLSRWSRDGIRCTRQYGAIACRNAAGAAISVGGARIDVSS